MRLWLSEEEEYVEVSFWSLWKAHLVCSALTLVAYTTLSILRLLAS